MKQQFIAIHRQRPPTIFVERLKIAVSVVRFRPWAPFPRCDIPPHDRRTAGSAFAALKRDSFGSISIELWLIARAEGPL
jgi:hypothetical protein